MKWTEKQVLINLKKARTSLDKIITMIEEDKYCIDVIQQNLAVMWLLKSANLQLLEWHLNCCFVDAAKSNNEARLHEMVWEILQVVKTAQSK